MSDSPFPEYMDAQHGQKRKTHRGRRSKGKGPKPTDHMAEANQHLENAKKDPTPQGTTAHLFKALSSLKRC